MGGRVWGACWKENRSLALMNKFSLSLVALARLLACWLLCEVGYVYLKLIYSIQSKSIKYPEDTLPAHVYTSNRICYSKYPAPTPPRPLSRSLLARVQLDRKQTGKPSSWSTHR